MKFVHAYEVGPRLKKSAYPEPFASMMEGRTKRVLGDLFGLKKFGVNLTELKPGAVSALQHTHEKQEELVFILKGNPILRLGDEEIQLKAGDCSGFAAGGAAHHLVNRSNESVFYLEIGDREQGDNVTYPNDDLVATQIEAGEWAFTHKDGTKYEEKKC